jgi:periplasmic protein TonB
MGYQALLFCPDEKLARVVSQVFSELDFTVDPVHEPFAAVKQLMSQRYDVVVVDCLNEQNASLLFKSARNSSVNQSSLTFALVEGQTGVAKAYRIGANLVLTKPINVEQAKGTLRIARGLLRKNSDASAGKTASLSAVDSLPASSRSGAPIVPPSIPDNPEIDAPHATSMPVPVSPVPAEMPAAMASAAGKSVAATTQAPVAQNRITIASEAAADSHNGAAQSPIKRDPANRDLNKNAVKDDAASSASSSASASSQNSASSSAASSGSAAATAPAKEVSIPPATSNTNIKEQKAAHAEPARSSEEASLAAFTINATGPNDAPTFGGLSDQDSAASGKNRKILIAAVIVLALAALGYLGEGRFNKPAASPGPTPASAPVASAQPVPAPAASPAPLEEQLDKPSSDIGATPATRISANPEPTTAKKSDVTPTIVKSRALAPKTQAQSEEAAPPSPGLIAAASPNDAKLTNLMASTSQTVHQPTLATLKVSQGVSQGLLIKRVQPKYPQSALAVHTQGAVQIEATINKEGSVVSPKVLSGDQVLAHAALDAVRQWRYKPYYLDGQPVEIQTQITITFKAN